MDWQAETEAEKRALKAWTTGEEADCEGLEGKEKTIRGDFLAALLRNEIENDGAASYKDFDLLGAVIEGEVDLRRSQVERNLYFWDGCQFDSGFDASWARLRALSFNRSQMKGSLYLFEAKLGGQFSARGTHFEAERGEAINAQGVEASDWHMGATPKRQTKVFGSLHLLGARLAGQFNANGVHFEVKSGNAIFAQGVEASDWFMGATPEHQTKVIGTLDIDGAKIVGQFGANGAHFEVPTGDAIIAQTATINGWFQRAAEGHKPTVRGGVHLVGATIVTGLMVEELSFKDGEFNLQGVTVEGRIDFHAGAMAGGLLARRITVTGEAKFSGQFDGPLDFTGAQMPELALDDPSSVYTDHVNLTNLKADDLYLPQRCPSLGLNLSRAKIGVLHDTKESWIPSSLKEPEWPVPQEAAEKAPITLRGLEYDRLENPRGKANSIKARIEWLKRQPPEEIDERFNPQPWRQLAKTLRRMGYEEDARKVSIQQRNTYCKSLSRWNPTRWGYGVLNIFGGYGYRPWLTALWSLGLIVASCAIFAQFDCSENECFDGERFIPVQGGEVRTIDNEQRIVFDENFDREKYPTFDPLLYSIDLFIPLVEFGITDLWVINDQYASVEDPKWYQRKGFLIQWWAVFLRFMGAFLSAYLIAGVTATLLRDDASV